MFTSNECHSFTSSFDIQSAEYCVKHFQAMKVIHITLLTSPLNTSCIMSRYLRLQQCLLFISLPPIYLGSIDQKHANLLLVFNASSFASNSSVSSCICIFFSSDFFSYLIFSSSYLDVTSSFSASICSISSNNAF